MLSRLSTQLDALPPDLRERLERYGFDREQFLSLARRLGGEGATDNRVRGRVEPPHSADILEVPSPGSDAHRQLESVGLEALKNGRVALVVLAGGMATRMGGVVKALVEVFPGQTFLDLRLRGMDSLEKKMGRPVPLWLMTSAATDRATRDVLGERLDGRKLALFPQRLSLRLTPDADLYLDASGKPSEYAPGHGDLPDSLKTSGLLSHFVESGGQVVLVGNLDNLGATVDPVLMGLHLSHGAPVTCEVADKLENDRGGMPVRLDGRPVVLEQFQIPDAFDPNTVSVFNTNTYTFDARTLLELDMDWTYFVVQKKADGLPVVQFERLLGEVTSHLDTRFVRIPRHGEASRFLPVKDPKELEERRSEIQQVARARGMLG